MHSIALKLEGGEIFSATARQIMRNYYGVDIGAYSYGSCFELGAFQRGVTIGRYVSVGPGVRAFRRNHPLNLLSTHPFFFNSALGVINSEYINFTPLSIEHDTWIGANVIITPSCTRIGIGSVIGAGSVVTHDVADFSIVAGIPAKHIRYRFESSLCDQIRTSRWWLFSIEQCLPFLDDMKQPIGAYPSSHALLRVLSNER